MIIATHERLAELTLEDSVLRLHIPQRYLETQTEIINLENGRQLIIIRDGIFDLMGVGNSTASARKNLHANIGAVLGLNRTIYSHNVRTPTPPSTETLINYLTRHAGFEIASDPLPVDFTQFEVIYTN